MARWHYDLTGAEPIFMEMPVYDASNLDNGELLMLGTTDPDSGADEGLCLVTAYDSTPANSAIDAVGILAENTYESGGTTPDNSPSTTTGPYYGKVIVNPFAVYLFEASQVAADDVAITSTSGTTLTISSLQDDIDGYWVYFPLNQTGVKYSLRYIVASASGSCTMASALSTNGGSSDTAIFIVPPLKYANNLTSDAKKTASGDATALSGATNLRVIEAYIQSDSHPLQRLRPAVHHSLNNLSNARFFNDIILKDHAFGVQQ